ncbi:hypothetical protein S83_029266 [Arachis hypogaea]
MDASRCQRMTQVQCNAQWDWRRGARVLKGSKCPLMAKDERWSVVGHVVFLWANAPSNSEIPGFSTDKII